MTRPPFPHHYAATLTGAATGHAALSSDGVPTLSTAPPAEFGGPGNAWSPELLLLGAVETCFLFTFRVVARASGLVFDHVHAIAEGTVDREDQVVRFTDILLRVRVRVPEGTDAVRVGRLVAKAERACLVTASLATLVRLETDVEVASPALAATG